MNRLEIIEAIDAEIERLQHARLLIIESTVENQSRHTREVRARRPTVDKKTENRRLLERPHAAQPTAIDQKPQVLVTRIAPREAPKQRIRAATKSKQWSALTGDVPQGPVAVPAQNRATTAVAANRIAAPTSAFGLAVTRGLASVAT